MQNERKNKIKMSQMCGKMTKKKTDMVFNIEEEKEVR